MANQSHLDILGQGVEYWNERRAPYNTLVYDPLVEPNLSGADLSEAYFSGANLTGTDLTGVNLTGTNLTVADLLGANLKGAILKEANLERAMLTLANLEGANLEGANLFGADLFGANLEGASLKGANLEGANLYWTNLRMTDLSMARLIEADLSRADPTKAEGMRFLRFKEDVYRQLDRKARSEDLEIISNATPSDRELYELRLGTDVYESWHARGEDNLSGVKLDGAWLLRANLSEADLKGASLEGARLNGADLSKADLSEANLSSADLSEANLSMVNLSEANLSEANLTGSTLVKTNLVGATLTGCSIYGISAWSLNLEGATQQNLNVSDYGEPAIMVDNLEVAQFVYLLLNNEKIRNVLDTIGAKGVLILGRFTEERKAVLDAIRVRLRELGFVPMMFDFEKPTQRDFTETINTLAGLSRFIIADITNPKSSPLEQQATMPNYMVPFVPIIQEDEEPFAMFRDLQQKYGEWVLDVLEYDSAANLLQVLDETVVRPALVKADQLIAKKAEAIRKRHVRDYQQMPPNTDNTPDGG